MDTELCITTDLALCTTKLEALSIGQSIAAMVVAERHLCLNLLAIKESKKIIFFDTLVSPSGLFGTAVVKVV